MPIYEYHCNDCNTDFEKLVFGSNPEVACERCGSKKTEKLMSRFGMGRSSNSSTSASSGSSSGCSGCSSSSCAGCK
ncbi:MAG: zinc ribbon domain-containing protein [Nitrospirota bacterium]